MSDWKVEFLSKIKGFSSIGVNRYSRLLESMNYAGGKGLFDLYRS